MTFDDIYCPRFGILMEANLTPTLSGFEIKNF